MENFDLKKLVRENIKKLKPYSSARSEYRGNAEVFIDANENAYGSPFEENLIMIDPQGRELTLGTKTAQRIYVLPV